MSDVTFTHDAAYAANDVHDWTRFAALVTTAGGTLLLLASTIGAAMGVVKYPKARGVIVAIGTVYAIGAMAMLCFAFLLARYGEKLSRAADLRSAGPLAEALPYETGIWAIVAGFVMIVVISVLLAVAGPLANMPLLGPEYDDPMAQPIAAENVEGLSTINWVSGTFAVVGLGLVLTALKKVDE